MRGLLLIVLIFSSYSLTSQCTYLAYDDFNYSNNTPMYGLSGGTGWSNVWDVQNADIQVPGYIATNGSLTYSNLQTLGNSAEGGSQYLTMGRRLNTSDSGPFSNFVASGNDGIGTATNGDTLWASFLLEKQLNDDQSVFASFHNDNLAWCHDCTNEKIAAGYFGTNSNNNSVKYWTLLINGTHYQSSIPLSLNQPTFFVVRFIFNAANTEIDLYINPSSLGLAGPPNSSHLNQTTSNPNVIRSIAAFLGSSSGHGKIDEIRMGDSYACVAPDNTVTINLPPTAIIVANLSSGQSPLLVNFTGTNSFDPEGQPLSYLWNFGDGSPTSTLINPSHTYEGLGEISASLTVTDNVGQQHTTYHTITLLDANNTFPCQTRVTCMQMASCGMSNGILRITGPDISYILNDNLGSPQTVTNGNEFHNLTPGKYALHVEGNQNVCTDSMDLVIRTDSTTCNGWLPSMCAMQIGTNMEGFADWVVARPMKNLMKHVRPELITYTAGCNCWDLNVESEINRDSSGYPLEIPQSTSVGNTMVRYVLSSEGGNLQEDSTYVLLYDGNCMIEWSGGHTIQSSAPNRIVFTATTSGNLVINLTQSTLNNHFRNVRLLKLSDEFADLEADPFYSGFVDKISPFSVLRYMDWGSTNGNPNISWVDRGHIYDYTYASSAGVPYETMIQLANQTKNDIWICIPHMANDDYILKMANLFKDSLDENIIVYLEYSNELWNWIFPQAHYNAQNKPSNLSYGRAMAEKAKNVFEIWHSVFSNNKCRVKRVLGIQAGFNSLNEEILSQLDQDEWDYGSPTHYFGLDHSVNGNPVLDANSTVADVMQNASNSFNGFKDLVKQDYNTVHVFGKEVITYEGGQHFVGNAFGVPYDYQQAMWDAQNSIEMYNMYQTLHDTIRSWGCKLATNFSLASRQESVYGSWGALPDIDTPPPYMNTAAKYQALLDNIPNNNCFTSFEWQGDESQYWSNPCNWNRDKTPIQTSDVLVPSNTPFSPMVNEDSTISTLTVEQNAVLTILSNIFLNVLN